MTSLAVAAGAALSLGLMSANAHDVVHGDHAHAHKGGCGHAAVAHDGHVDYLHDGHLHHAHEQHVHEHVVAVSSANPVDEDLTTKVANDRHAGADDRHESVQHGDHFDHLHDGRLHHAHGDHVDDHGPVELLQRS